MTGPRDAPTRFAVPVNYETGKELSTRQQLHLVRLTEAGEALYAAMHEAEGSSLPGEHQEHGFQSRRMSIAATHIETALMYAPQGGAGGEVMGRWAWRKVEVRVQVEMPEIAAMAAQMGITPRAFLSRIRDMRFEHPDLLVGHLAYQRQEEPAE